VVIRGKVARQLRDLCRYKDYDHDKPNLLVKRKEQRQRVILDPNGEQEYEGMRFSIKEYEHDICQLHCSDIRQVYQDLKKQWYDFTATDHKSVKENN